MDELHIISSYSRAQAIEDGVLIVRRSANASLVEFEREGIKYLLHIGPGDQGEPVLTLMLPSDW